MPAQDDPTITGFRQMRLPDSPSAVEVTNSTASITAGPSSTVICQQDTGVHIAGDNISLWTTPESIKIAGIFALNPWGWVPDTPYLIMNGLPVAGVTALQSALQQYISFLTG